MALSITLIPDGLLHAKSQGQVDVGPGYGQVAALGAGQLLKLLLPFAKEVINKPGYQEQFYVLTKSLDGNITAGSFALDPVQFETDPATGKSVLRLLVDITATPADVEMWLEAHHSAGR